MNSRGQAFSVFQLLIAAVMAGAILVILLQVLGALPGISQDPNEVAGSSVQTQIDNIGSPAFKNVTFENGSNLTSKTIADQSKALSPDQICVGVSEDVPNAETDFVVNGTPGAGTGTNIVYDGAFTQKARILVYCDSETDIDGDGGINDFTYNFELPSFDDCSFGESSSRACIVIVVPGI